MSTQEQTNSNRQNAQSSTGPKTAEGKAISSQNAVKHGFFAKNDVIPGEDPAAYEAHRQDICDEYAPMTPTESVLTQRIASLSWRLMRADRLQTTTINTLVTGHYADPPYSTRQLLAYPSTTESPPCPAISEPELVLGGIIYDDFLNSKVIERLSIYERRTENSLFKTIRLIDQLQERRTKTDAAQDKRDWAYLRAEDEAERNRREAEYRQRIQNEPNPRTGTACPAPNAQNEPNPAFYCHPERRAAEQTPAAQSRGTCSITIANGDSEQTNHNDANAQNEPNSPHRKHTLTTVRQRGYDKTARPAAKANEPNRTPLQCRTDTAKPNKTHSGNPLSAKP